MSENLCAVDAEATSLSVVYHGETMRFHAIWLRDNAQDEHTRVGGSGQRLLTLTDIPNNTRIASAHISGERLLVTFSPDHYQTQYDLAWLRQHRYDKVAYRSAPWVASTIETWNHDRQASLVVGDWRQMTAQPKAKADWLACFLCDGFGVINVGDTRDGALHEVIAQFGYVRETNYGSLFNVRTEVNPSNLAFTGLGLQAHTDNPYRDPVPTVQILYCLENSAAGGENMLVDGFACALRLYQETPEYFEVLSRYCARFEYVEKGNTILRSKRPMIELCADNQIRAIRFNNRSFAAPVDVPFEQMETYYAAYRAFAKIIDDPTMEISFKLNPGECFLVDNTRVLHARKGYSGSGNRWLQGAYADIDGFRSTYDVLEEAV
ncbi:MAG: TauD/TfdA family dioxygenase [Gammaproteobacteria bacterium]|nr:TauD/TfdA family dioxygenase [Gammaproteobacteria bacterium]